eukprot:CAMPEP_0182842812 /NCGR_PEP_ID=MMETSP0006_2-20121128/25846_1 /TAXON_ID=97485 /ORGANISM="Prymnesium parvum, Strain Texoma1" /LENGTH=171 /DNA_ID=CAMNT_0024972547 /DNA_START=414 /DNA_END=929 /DNA_ORIENTATION=-
MKQVRKRQKRNQDREQLPLCNVFLLELSAFQPRQQRRRRARPGRERATPERAPDHHSYLAQKSSILRRVSPHQQRRIAPGEQRKQHWAKHRKHPKESPKIISQGRVDRNRLCARNRRKPVQHSQSNLSKDGAHGPPRLTVQTQRERVCNHAFSKYLCNHRSQLRFTLVRDT